MTALGIYHGLSSDAYHGSPGLSRSRLKVLLEGTPLDFHAATTVEETPAMARGTALHYAILEPELFSERVVSVPDFGDQRFKENKLAKAKWHEENADMLAGKVLVGAIEYARCKDAANRVRSKRGPAAALRSGNAEVSLYWEQSGVLTKARPDFLALDASFAVDVKSSGRGLDDRSITSILVDHYAAMQAAMVVNGVSALTGKLLVPYLLVVRLADPIDMRFVRIGADWIEYGEAQFLTALAKYQECVASGKWPGWIDADVTELPAPVWVKSRAEEMRGNLLQQV